MTSELVQQQNPARQRQDWQARHHDSTQDRCSQQAAALSPNPPATQRFSLVITTVREECEREARENSASQRPTNPSTSYYYHAHASSFLFFFP
jgi:hypothetical protein